MYSCSTSPRTTSTSSPSLPSTGLIDFKGVVLFASHDHEFTQTVANRIIEILPEGGTFDRVTTYDEYLEMRG